MTDVIRQAPPQGVRVEGLGKVFRGRNGRTVRAVHDVNFTIAAGACLGIAGESGSGKSTVARMLVGLETPTTGDVWVAGQQLAESPSAAERRAHARRVQMVFQDPYSSLDPRQSIGASLDEVQRVHFDRTSAQRRARSLQLLDAVGLDEGYAKALPRTMSGGQRQRLVIARALSVEPSVLVLDEAVSALDVSTQAQILNLLKDLQEEFSLTYIFISHDLSVIRQVSDEVLVLYLGEVMENSAAESLFTQPQHPYTQLLLNSVPHPGMVLERRAARSMPNDEGCRFASRCELVHDRCAHDPPQFETRGGTCVRCWLADSSTDPTTSETHD
ncbi:MAG: ABC transporter ATP-binding protein [Nostocoides sp.]